MVNSLDDLGLEETLVYPNASFMLRLLEFSLDRAALGLRDELGEETDAHIFGYSNLSTRDTERRFEKEECKIKNCMGIKADLKILKVYKDKVYLVTPQTYAESFKGKTKASDLLRYFQGRSACTLLANKSHDLQHNSDLTCKSASGIKILICLLSKKQRIPYILAGFVTHQFSENNDKHK